jgi:hypothetical protein
MACIKEDQPNLRNIRQIVKAYLKFELPELQRAARELLQQFEE